MKFKMTKEEKHWVLYDVGNSAFVLMVSTIMPIYFYYLANKGGISSVDYLAYWGYIGSCVPFILCLFIVFGKDKIGISMKKAMMICFTLVALNVDKVKNRYYTIKHSKQVRIIIFN